MQLAPPQRSLCAFVWMGPRGFIGQAKKSAVPAYSRVSRFLLLALVLQLGQGMTRSISPALVPGGATGLDFLDPSVWSPPGVPSMSDTIIVDLSNNVCSPLVTQFYMQIQGEVTAQLSSLTITTNTSDSCQTFFLVNGTLNADSVVVAGGMLQVAAGGTIVAGTFHLQSGATLQGSGVIVTTGASFLDGDVMPGQATLCEVSTQCFGDTQADQVATLTFRNSVEAEVGGNLWIKLQPAPDTIIFTGSVDFVSAQILVVFQGAVAPNVTGVVPIQYAAINADSTLSTQSLKIMVQSQYPWDTTCGETCVPPPSCTSCSIFQPPGTPCTQPSATGLSVVVQVSTTCEEVAAPSCVHGTLVPVLGICTCPSSNGFTWSGATCSVPVCPNNCGGAIR